MKLAQYLRGKFNGALCDLLKMSEGKDPPKQRCWRCDAGIPRTGDGFHEKRPGVYAVCSSPSAAESPGD